MGDHNDQQKRASGYFLVGLGAPIAAAFIYPFLLGRGRRGRAPMIDFETLTMPEIAVFLIGAGTGLVMLITGWVLLKRR